eukprot:3737879-Rhodomonas_salina.4
MMVGHRDLTLSLRSRRSQVHNGTIEGGPRQYDREQVPENSADFESSRNETTFSSVSRRLGPDNECIQWQWALESKLSRHSKFSPHWHYHCHPVGAPSNRTELEPGPSGPRLPRRASPMRLPVEAQ